jgi:hypothetical protein
MVTVSFTAPEVKSNELSTALPTTSGPTRMSSQDVARAFQQVPNSPANQAATAKANGLIANQPVLRPNPVPMPPPMIPAGIRAAYPSYPSPMMNSPSPPILGYPPAMASSPVPRPMAVTASSPHYTPGPMWMAAPTPPNGPPGMMRPVTSPYGPQLMPYSTAGAVHMYPPLPPNMRGSASPHANSIHGRPPMLPMMSPVPPQAQAAHLPMYATSPVMVHAMPGMPPPGTSYSGSTTQGRGPGHAVPNMIPQSPSFGPQHPSAYPVQPSSYARTPW